MLQKLEKEIANFGKDQDSHVAAAKTKLKAANAALEQAKKQLKAKQTAQREAAALANAAGAQRAALNEQLQASAAIIQGAIFACT